MVARKVPVVLHKINFSRENTIDQNVLKRIDCVAVQSFLFAPSCVALAAIFFEVERRIFYA